MKSLLSNFWDNLMIHQIFSHSCLLSTGNIKHFLKKVSLYFQKKYFCNFLCKISKCSKTKSRELELIHFQMNGNQVFQISPHWKFYTTSVAQWIELRSFKLKISDSNLAYSNFNTNFELNEKQPFVDHLQTFECSLT